MSGLNTELKLFPIAYQGRRRKTKKIEGEVPGNIIQEETKYWGRCSEISYKKLLDDRIFGKYGEVGSIAPDAEKFLKIDPPTNFSFASKYSVLVGEGSCSIVESRLPSSHDSPPVAAVSNDALANISVYKPIKHRSAGLRPPIKNVLESEGYENFFAYRGQYRNGSMHGRGVYTFDFDGATHEGEFVGDLPSGAGVPTYNADLSLRFDGRWADGRPHGRRTASYASGT